MSPIGSRAARSDARNVAIVDATTGTSTTYAELHRTMLATAAGLRGLGVRRGDRVVMVLDNSPEFVEYLFATAALGAIAVPVNFRLSAPEVAFIIDDAQPQVVVYGSRLAELANVRWRDGDTTRPRRGCRCHAGARQFRRGIRRARQ